MTSKELKKLHKEIGDSIHAMNTIAVGLSIMPDKDVKIPEGLRISWQPKNIPFSKMISRSYAEKSAIVYATENLYEYLKNISINPLWNYPGVVFDNGDGKANNVFKFLSSVPQMENYVAILTEFLCHWRNKIVHLNSNAKLDKKKIKVLILKKGYIYDNLHHFGVEEALDNFNNSKITLKDSSTLITVALKSCEMVDEYFLQGISQIENIDKIISIFKNDVSFRKIYNSSPSPRRTSKVKMWILTNYPYFDDARLDLLCA